MNLDFSDGLGEGNCFHELLECEQGFLRALIRTIGIPGPDVDDVLQDANLYLVANQSKFLPGTHFRAWAAQVVRFRTLSYFRARKRRPTVNLSEQALDLIAGEVVRQFDQQQARLDRLPGCLEKLPEEQRQLMFSFYRDGESLKKLARTRGCSHAAMRKTVSRIRQWLEACIESGIEDE